MNLCVLSMVFFTVSVFPVIDGNTCVYGDWFGDKPQFDCHCGRGTVCDTDGEFEDTMCARGWFGPQCQYKDLIRGAEQVPPLLNDGDSKTCVSINTMLADWMGFTPSFRFTWMRLVGESAKSLENIGLWFKTNESESVLENPPLVKLRVNDTVLDVHGQFNETIKGVAIDSINGTVELCSLYVSGGRNVAMDQYASQSSTYSSYTANKAVDGDNYNDFDADSCTHTARGDTSPSWTLNFSSTPVEIDRYILYNRDESECRLQYFQLREVHSNKTARTYTDTRTAPESIYDIQYAAPKQVDSVTISISRRNFPQGVDNQCLGEGYPLWLTLCEVEAYGDSVCASDKWGRRCEKSCNCQNSAEKCFVSTGMCPSGCKAGYRGLGCAHECPAGRYGVDCQFACKTSCQDNSKCDRANGHCEECPVGREGDFCDQECHAGTYGKNCSEPCSPNCLNSQCHHIHGSCNSCPAGYEGLLCDEKCRSATHGMQCKELCPSTCLFSQCHHINGSCSNCTAGYQGEFCEKECDEGTFGTACVEQCPQNCLNNQCHHVDGVCNSCTAGFQGTNCEQECPTGLYGVDCQFTCEATCLDNQCDRVNGHCQECPVGQQGHFCDQECDAGTYGKNCSNTCSPTCMYSQCDHVDGSCNNCIAGYEGLFCETECPAGRYGVDCQFTCETPCLYNRTCDHVTGQCVGCPVGKQGFICDQACTHKFYGEDCAFACSANCKQDLNSEPAVCHPETGACLLGGCKDGFVGEKCVDEDPALSSFLIVVAVVMLLVGVAVVAVFFVRRKWQKKKSAEVRDESPYDEPENGQAVVKPSKLDMDKKKASVENDPSMTIVELASTPKEDTSEKGHENEAFCEI